MNTSNKEIPDWTERSSKKVIRHLLSYEISQLPPHPKGIHSFHLPGRSMECIKTFEALKLPISKYIGIEEIEEQYIDLRDTKRKCAKSLQEKCIFKKGILNDLLIPEDKNKALREKMMIQEGFHINYLDFMGGFQPRTRTTLSLFCNSPEIFQHTIKDNFPTLLFLTWNTRTNPSPEMEMLEFQRKIHPENQRFSQENHQPIYLKYFLGIHTFINDALKVWGLKAEATHRIAYRQDNSSVMLSMGIKIAQQDGLTTPFGPNIVYIGVQNQQTNEKSLITLADWQSKGIFDENFIPGQSTIHRTIHHLHSLGKTNKEIHQITSVSGHPLTEKTIEAILKLPIPKIQESKETPKGFIPKEKPKNTPTKMIKIPTKPASSTKGKSYGLPSIQSIAQITEAILKSAPNRELKRETLEGMLILLLKVSPSSLQNHETKKIWRNHIAHAKLALLRAGKIKKACPGKPVQLT